MTKLPPTAKKYGFLAAARDGLMRGIRMLGAFAGRMCVETSTVKTSRRRESDKSSTGCDLVATKKKRGLDKKAD
tara:strand:+ start:435 stop:656 length:222 start_codon:yes stop_codon:yes gene_type:complete